MVISEKKFMEELKKDEDIPLETQIILNDTYQHILSDEYVLPHKNKRKRVYLIGVAVLFLCIGLFYYSPLGTATVNFLRFGKFTSETLNDKGFISQQQSTANNQGIDVQLTELYADKNELGLHFTVYLPKNSDLLNKKWEDYSLNFAIKNNQNQYLVDFRSGLTEGKENLKLFGSINAEQAIDPDTNTLEFIYKLHSTKSGTIPLLNNAMIQINGITAYKESEPKDYHIFHGSWELPIEGSKIKHFDGINFTPKNNDLLPIHQAIAYPTSFVIRFKDEQDFLKKLPEYTGTDTIQLKVVNGDNVTYYPYSKFTSVTEASNKFWDMTFTYSGYDQKASLYLELKGVAEIKLEKNK